MNNNAARKVSATPAPFPAAEVFLARVEARAILYHWHKLDLHEAVDGLQEAAVAYGLVDELGQDAVQAMMAEAFADLDLNECRFVAFAKLGQEMLAEAPPKPVQTRDLSAAQLREVIARLIRLRSRYPAITDKVLLQLGEQLP